MDGGRILAFIVVFEWLHREIGSLKSPSKKMLSAPRRFWCSEGNGCIDLTRPG